MQHEKSIKNKTQRKSKKNQNWISPVLLYFIFEMIVNELLFE